jgi:peptidoglycan hydrolase-like protein with peptidoglycan-binding domain
VVRKPGRYRTVVRYNDPDLLSAHAGSSSWTTQLPSLSLGARSGSVKTLERRLIALGYYLPGADRVFDIKTYDAMIAFNKVQRRARVGSVTASTWQALSDPIRARPRLKTKRFHIEIDQTRQVVLVVDNAKVQWILHTSTGAGGITHDGNFQVTRKLGGTSGGGLYYPSYFDGLRAIHGWPEVPTYPASHGCSRVPMWAAQWIYGLAEIGTRVIVYH